MDEAQEHLMFTYLADLFSKLACLDDFADVQDEQMRILLYAMYARHSEGHFPVSVMNVQRMIPARHAQTCRKRIDHAIASGLVSEKPHEIDRRKKMLKLTKAGIRWVESELEEYHHGLSSLCTQLEISKNNTQSSILCKCTNPNPPRKPSASLAVFFLSTFSNR